MSKGKLHAINDVYSRKRCDCDQIRQTQAPTYGRRCRGEAPSKLPQPLQARLHAGGTALLSLLYQRIAQENFRIVSLRRNRTRH